MTQSEEQADQDPSSGRRRSRLTITLTGCPDGLAEAIREAARHTLRSQSRHQGELEIAFVSEAEIRRQHARWMGEDSTTDVLSFDLRKQPNAGLVDGQLLVCKSVAQRRARSRKTDWRGELLLYVVHGCLHLCGLNDHDEAGATGMHRLEDRILSDLGWGMVFSRSGRGGGKPKIGRLRGGGR